MITEDGVKYVKQQVAIGYAVSDIRKALSANGWKQEDIEELLLAAGPTRQNLVTGRLEEPGNLLRKTLEAYRDNLDTVVKILLPVLIIMVLGVAILPVETASHQSVSIIRYPSQDTESLVAGVWAFLQSITTVFMSLALIAYAQSGRTLSAEESWRKGAGFILSYAWVAILEALAIFGGFLLLIIPGIIFAGWFSFSNIIVVAEGLKGTTALRQSRAYVQGRWWAIVGRLLFLGLIIFAFYFLFTILTLALDAIRPMPHVTGLLYAVLAVLMTPVSFFYIYELYQSARQVAQTEQAITAEDKSA